MADEISLRDNVIRMLDERKQQLENYLEKHIIDCKTAGFKILSEMYDGDVDRVAMKLRKAIDFARAISPPLNIDLTYYINAGNKYGQLIV